MPLLLQPVAATTLNVKKELCASLDKVAAGLKDGLRGRSDQMEWEPVGPEPRQVLRPSPKKKKRKHQKTRHLRKQRKPLQPRAQQDPKTPSMAWWRNSLEVFGPLLRRS